ncbi:unnamed protein product [Rotaria socialis]|uniref:C2H2-type domain-containing protein n=7 Tax=Rotaria socialis TaxID=392032 RepID=A0A817V1V1_9BILA|nr:unnamed protein product [Rotaria socialis]CAF3337337.1 unnamed protein product [Rotaria socialis]CAF3366541.1 unnamed protein product [Rotaria socialis]CAF4456620.1 unnamed protein product [Rotaria socialis]CAF4561778.1 unnamed protein product [Rotaria socialis]
MMLSVQHTNMDAKSTSDETLSTSMVSEINDEKENIPLCSYCRKSFANYSNLRHHIQIVHLKESKWDCSKCGKICSSKSNLKVHFRTHIRVKPYTCKYCEYDCMHHSSIKDHLTKNHPDKPHTSIEPGYNYNSQAVPEPDEFNAVDFDPAKFVEQQTQCKQRQSIIVDNNGTLKYTQTMTTTTKNTSHANNHITITKPKRFRSDTNLLETTETSPSITPSFPFLAPTPFPLWPFNLYHPSYIPAMMNAIRLSSLSNSVVPPIHEEKHPIRTNRKSFEIEGILNLSLRDNKRKNLSDTISSEEEDSI